MKYRPFLTLLILLCVAVEAHAQMDPWLMKGHDARRTGQSASNGPREIDPVRSWTVELPGAHTINVGASISADGAFFGSWGLLRRPAGNPDPRFWNKMDGDLYGLRCHRYSHGENEMALRDL